MSDDIYEELVRDLQVRTDENVNLRLSLKKCHQEIEKLERDVFRYKMLLAKEDEMMNSLGWSKSNPEKRLGK